MKTFIPATLTLVTLLSLASCLKPDPLENETAVKVTYVDVMATQAYARDVVAYGSRVFVAASQVGSQIWDTSGDTPEKLFQYDFNSPDPFLRIVFEPSSRLLFAFDKAQMYFKLLNPALSGLDSAYIKYGVHIDTEENSGLFGSGSNEDMIPRFINDSLVAVYVIDRTSNDGFKQYYFNHLTHVPNPFIPGDQAFKYWAPSNVGNSTGGINLGMDMRDSLVAISKDELGLGLYILDGIVLDTVATIDTRGEALEVSFFGDYLLCANNWAGMGVYRMDLAAQSLSFIADVEVNGWVKQISIWGDIAILSCGENSIFLVDLSDPEHPQVDQWIDAGYTYRTFIQDDILLAATREGVKRYTLQTR